MADFSKIQNQTLRDLMMRSESLRSLSETALDDMIRKVSVLPPEGQNELIRTFENEQNVIRKAKLARGATPESELAEVEANLVKVTAIKRTFDGDKRKIDETHDRVKDDALADELLNNL